MRFVWTPGRTSPITSIGVCEPFSDGKWWKPCLFIDTATALEGRSTLTRTKLTPGAQAGVKKSRRAPRVSAFQSAPLGSLAHAEQSALLGLLEVIVEQFPGKRRALAYSATP